MRPIFKAWFCHIEVTNFCEKSCVYCSRWTRHLRRDQYFYMRIDEIAVALETLLPRKKSAIAWPNRIGIIGGEPTVHHDFKDICELLLRWGPKQRWGLWTYGGKKYKEYESLINKTFGLIAYNEHNPLQEQTCRHQPATVASGEVIKDKALLATLIDKCWVQLNWCPSIAQNKTYFCEVAYGIDRLFGIDGGWDLDYEWFMKHPKDFKDQVDKYCHLCGMPVPMQRQLLEDRIELVTPKLLERMKAVKLRHTGHRSVKTFDEQFSLEDIKENLKTWDPRNYRGDNCSDSPERYHIL